jgi:CubicO group peptidase (beta-lactamase class C family)
MWGWRNHLQSSHRTPGVDFSYSNNNYCVLRALVEAIAGQDYVSYVNSHVFVPFGVLDTTGYPDPIDPALAYSVSGGAIDQSPGVLGRMDWTSVVSGFGWYASAIDMIRFVNGLRTFAVLSPERSGEMFNRGLGWYPVDTAAGPAFVHGGLGHFGHPPAGVHTLVAHLPEGYDATVLINTVNLAYVNQVVDPAPFTDTPGCCPTLDAAVDAFNFYWDEMQ